MRSFLHIVHFRKPRNKTGSQALYSTWIYTRNTQMNSYLRPQCMSSMHYVTSRNNSTHKNPQTQCSTLAHLGTSSTRMFAYHLKVQSSLHKPSRIQNSHMPRSIRFGIFALHAHSDRCRTPFHSHLVNTHRFRPTQHPPNQPQITIMRFKITP